MYTQRDTEFWKDDFFSSPTFSICPLALLTFSLLLSTSFSLAFPQESYCVLFRSHVSRYMCYVRTHSSYVHIHEETSIIIDSKSRLKHRNAVACLYKIPKNTIPYHGLCCWMTLVTVRWLLARFLSVCLFDARHLVARKVSSSTERAYPCHFDWLFFSPFF